ncbi:hypothetical protein OIU78_028135 [Salix suchowensis]|nr:hypothetical protein OIU78_028135 [Salix suchowensis]
MAIQKIFSVLFLQLVFAFLLVELTNAGGLQLGFYQRTCPDAEFIVHQALYRYISRDRTLAASLLRMHFHDCFIRGRRDGRVSIANEALFNLPPPFANITVLKQQFAGVGLSVKDLAVLSGM